MAQAPLLNQTIKGRAQCQHLFVWFSKSSNANDTTISERINQMLYQEMELNPEVLSITC